MPEGETKTNFLEEQIFSPNKNFWKVVKWTKISFKAKNRPLNPTEFFSTKNKNRWLGSLNTGQEKRLPKSYSPIKIPMANL